MIFLSRSWHGSIATDDPAATIAAIADWRSFSGEGLLPPSFRGETNPSRIENSIRLE
jgi:hypothetical protein